jgi:hypothetical protein
MMNRGVLGLTLLLTAACVPVIAGALIVKGSKSKGQQQEFMSQLQRTNMEREQKGLRPLDWCSEAYRFDKGWAMRDVSCAKRIEAYEAGDSAVLDGSSLPAVRPDSTIAADSAVKKP